ncbi:MAG: signal recognition particle protein [Candidatus Sabulitectum sp.]|nr:signal recognition particle protein [Candidatus Sabulitectum sp.]
MFDKLSNRLGQTFRNLSGRGILTESNISDAMREIRRALLEADVNFKVAKKFVSEVAEKALGEKVLKSLTPGQQVVKIVNDQIVELLGTTAERLVFTGKPPHVILLLGLQGSGKTTTAARLAYLLQKKHNRRCMVVAADLQRPAAIDQLEVMAKKAGTAFYCDRSQKNPAEVAKAAIHKASLQYNDIVIVDTAGRLHVDSALMDELERVKSVTHPDESLLVLDGLSGQDAVNVALEFNKKIGFTGAVLTKMDGDSRGGAALSFRSVTGKPIKFIGVGESVKGLEEFDPPRMAGRILGMGDVVGLAEKAQEMFDEKEAAKLQKKIKSNSFNLEDFRKELVKIKKMGSLSELMAMLPKGMRPVGADLDSSHFTQMEVLINSMTAKERLRPEIINGSRRKRIAKGSGRTVMDVNRLLKEYRTMKKMMKGMRSNRGMAALFR